MTTSNRTNALLHRTISKEDIQHVLLFSGFVAELDRQFHPGRTLTGPVIYKSSDNKNKYIYLFLLSFETVT